MRWACLVIVFLLAFVTAFCSHTIATSMYREYRNCVEVGMEEGWCFEAVFHQLVFLGESWESRSM